jgi:hypothetical protein
MDATLRPIRQVRVDIPLRGSRAYLFIDSEMEKWDPWWERLYSFLLTFATDRLEWRHEPTQDVFVARPTLTDEQRLTIVAFLRTAPPREAEGHRTLRRAIELKPERERQVDLMYFSGAIPVNSP